MNDAAFCPRCGTQRQPAMTFCGKCGLDFGSTQPAPPPGGGQSVQGSLSAGLYEIEQLRVKLIMGRLLTMAVALVVWWWAIPIIKDPLLLIVTLLVALVGGLWLGTMLTLSFLRGK